jgi:hypothetical protein
MPSRQDSHPSILESARVIYQAMAAQGLPEIFATRCCSRIYIGDAPAKMCRTCKQVPNSVRLLSDADLEDL